MIIRAYSPDKPFFMYWAPGAVHGPHHVAKPSGRTNTKENSTTVGTPIAERTFTAVNLKWGSFLSGTKLNAARR